MKNSADAAHALEGDAVSSSSDSSGSVLVPETNGGRHGQDDISNWLKAYVARVADLTPEEIDGGKPFIDYGLTSKETVFLSGELADWLGRELNPTLLWEHPTIEALSCHLGTASAHTPAGGPSPASRQPATNDKIAIVALACRLPGAASPEAFWELLRRGKDAITEIPPERWDAQRFYRPGPASPATMNTRWGGFLEKVDEFDPLFFGISPLEAARMDPQQRLLLEVTWEALENAGQAPQALVGSPTGVFIGISSNDYAQRQFGNHALLDAYAGTGNAHSIAANRISYVLGLRGPSLAVDTACSSALVAVHLACQSLRTAECDLAIAGGVNVILTPDLTIAFSQAGMMASDGRCKTFDAGADGYVRSEGCGVVLLKRYADAVAAGDQILAVIHGTAVNHDGISNGLTAPSGAAQQEVIRRALRQAGLQPAQLSYVEAHGTGTPLGDPIEMDALKAVLMPGRSPTQRCLVGSAKGNIGHLEAAAGIAGMIKVILALQQGEIPPQVNFRRLNPHISLERTTFHIPTRGEPWPQAPGARFAGVSSFGFGGTNAHVIVGEAPAAIPAPARVPERTGHLLLLSARGEQALRGLARQYQETLLAPGAPSLADVCFSANPGRNHWTHRLAATASSTGELAQHLADFIGGGRSRAVHVGQPQKATPPRVVFLFTGQGAQYPGMGHQLYASEPVFREAVDRCDALLRPHLKRPLTSILYPDTEEAGALLQQTLYTQPALFTLGYALAELWRSWGVTPDVVLGHSVGEYVAAHVAGMIGLADILELLVTRARLMQALPPDGAMATVMADEHTVRAALRNERELAIAALNGPENVVISGEQRAVHRVSEALRAREILVRPLAVSHAYHSPLMEPMLDELEQTARRLVFQRPGVPLISTLTGEQLTGSPDAAYWRRHAREPVQFEKSLRTVAQRGPSVFIELGPHDTLLAMAKRCVPSEAGAWFPSLKRKQDPWQTLFDGLGALYARGAAIDWRAVDRPHSRQRVRLPNYPFERQRCWLDTPDSPPSDIATGAASRGAPLPPPAPNAAMSNEPSPSSPSFPSPVSRQQRLLDELRSMTVRLLQIPAEKLSVSTSLLELGADSIVLLDAVRSVERQFGVKLTLRQLFEEFTTLEALAVHLDRTLPPEAERPAPPAPVASAAAPPAQPAAVAPPPVNGAVEQLIEMQLQVMSQQLALLGGRGAASPSLALPASTATAPSARSLTPEATARAAQPDASPSGAAPFSAGSLSGTPERALPAAQQRHLDALVSRYQRRTPGSRRHAVQYRAQWSDVRWMMNFRPELKEVCYPIVSHRAQGSRFWDVDGNAYVDLAMGFGVHLFGHSPPFIVEALRRRLDLGMELGPQSDLAGQAAALICELTGMKRVTFCNSGTEAVMTALRLARAATRRSKIVMFLGSYHGHSDGTLVVSRTVNGQLQSLPMAAGVPRQVAEDVLVLPYGEAQSLEIIRGHLHELAGVLVEPIQSRRPNLQPKAFLQTLREMTRAAGVPLIFDEVITGFRLHPGGAQAWLGIEADLVTYGKVVGGGMPIGVVADRGGFVDRIDGGDWRYGDHSYPAVETTFAAGTFCKHPLSMAATIAALTHLKQEGPALQARLNQRATGLVERLNGIFQREQVPLEAVHCGSVIRFAFVKNFSYLYQPLEMDVFFCHLIERGVYVWEGRTCMLSTAHTDADIEAILRGVAETVAEMRSGGFWPGPNPLPPSPRPPRRMDVTEAGAGKSPAREEHRTQPLTEAQRQLWLLAQLHPGGSSAYHLRVSLRMEGPLQAEALRRAIQQVVERHESLRVQISETGEHQVVLPSVEVPFPVQDLSALSSEERAERLAAWHVQESQTPLDLHRAPLLRAHLLKLGALEHVLVLTTHHIVADGWSLSVILQEIAALYSARQAQGGPCLPAPQQWEDYLQWSRRYSETEEMAAHERFWLEQRPDEVARLELPVDFSPPAQRDFRGARHVQRLEPALVQAAKNLAQQQHSTLFMLLLSVYTSLLHRLTGQEELLVGIPAAGRGQEESKDLVGYCSHLLPIISRARADQTFSEYHSGLKQVLWAAYAHQDYPFARLLNRLSLPRSADRTPLVNVTFNLERPLRVQDMAGLRTSVHAPPISFSPFELSLNVAEVEDGLVLVFDYSSVLFKAETLTRWARCFQTLLEHAVAHPQQALGRLPLLTAAERHRLLVEWNQTERPYPKEHLLHQLVGQRAASASEQVAVEYEGQCLTFAELEQQANRLAHGLRALGVREGTLVGCCLERSPEVIVTLLAILKAGGAYLPLDPEHPRERLKFLVEDSRLAVVVTRERLVERLPAQHARLLCLDRDAGLISAQSPEAPGNLATPTTPAYVIYTSGSTGEPKGVVVNHGALVLHCQDVVRHYALSASDRVLQFASLNFDASLEQILPALMVGATLVLRGPQPWPPDELARRVVEQRLTVMNLPTAAWQQLAQWWAESSFSPGEHAVRLVIVGGDTILPRTLELWSRGPLASARLLNAYGPTEASITATTHEVPVGSIAPSACPRIPIGRPLANRTLYILDRNQEPVPVGTPGELYIGGEVLALGYLHRPELTAQRFIADPFSDKPTARLYRTGDLARYLPEGTVEFLGRTDHQVKIRGFRIELGEIESVLSRHPAVREVVVTVDGEGSAGDKRLVAYVVPASAQGVTGMALRHHLQERLPDYMVPAFFVLLDAMPLTASGKLNRRALPPVDPAALPATRPFVAPHTPTEQALAELWSQTLRLPRVGVHDDFFELGGDSLLATRVASHLRRMLKVEVPLNSLFKETTIARLAEHLDTLVWAAQASTPPPASPAAREEGDL